MSNPTKGKWFKFNDTDVEEFDMTDSSIETECFGGTYKTKVFEQCKLPFFLLYFCSSEHQKLNVSTRHWCSGWRARLLHGLRGWAHRVVLIHALYGGPM